MRFTVSQAVVTQKALSNDADNIDIVARHTLIVGNLSLSMSYFLIHYGAWHVVEMLFIFFVRNKQKKTQKI